MTNNYRKSFNLRNGVQVDNDNFIVNSNGLVGIGTSTPKNYLLSVYGDANITGLITASNIIANNLNIGVVTSTKLNTESVSASSSVTAAVFYGNAAGLSGIYAIAVDGWHISGGNISTTSNVGIGTTLPNGNFQVGIGATINSNGNASYLGIVSAYSFSGFGTDITNINASNISSGTLSNSRLQNNVDVIGIVSAYSFSGFGTDITNINASNISSGTLSNSRLQNNVDVIGIVSAYSFSGFGTDITNINASNISSGTLSNSRLPSNVIAYSFSGFGTDITNINASNISSGTLSNSRLPSNINVVGVITASNFYGIASTAQSITGSPNIVVTNITATNSNVTGISTISTIMHVGSGGTAFAALESGRIGVGTALPTSEVQIRKSSGTLVEVISDSGESRISIGNSVGVGRSTAVLRFGSQSKTFDIINNDTGNINSYLHAGPAGVGTGRFAWLYGQSNAELASLTYDGKFGIGITNPTSNLHVVGTSTVTGNANFGSNVTISGNLTVGNITLPEIISNVNINNSSGVSTFNDIKSSRILSISQIGINTTNPLAQIDAQDGVLLINRIGIGTTVANVQLDVQGGTLLVDSIGVGTTSIYVDPLAEFSSGVQFFDKFISVYDGGISLYGDNSVGFNTSSPRSILDFGQVGSASTVSGYFIPPSITTADRNQLTNNIGVGGTIEGAIIYNSTTKKHQGYGSLDGGSTFGWQNLY